MGKPDQVKVHFFENAGQIKGRIVEDLSGQGRRKPVLIDRGYKGPTPKPGDEHQVEIVKDTRLDDPTRGVLFVQPNMDKRVPYAPSPWVNACKRLGLDYNKVREDLEKLEHELENRNLTVEQRNQAFRKMNELDSRLGDASDRDEVIAYRAWCSEVTRLDEKYSDTFNNAGRALGRINDLLDLIPRGGVEYAERMIKKAYPEAERLNKILPKIREAKLLHKLPLIKDGAPYGEERPSSEFFEGAREYWEREIAKLNDWVEQIKALEVELRPIVDEFRQLIHYESLRERAEAQGRVKEEKHRREHLRSRYGIFSLISIHPSFDEEDGETPPYDDVD